MEWRAFVELLGVVGRRAAARADFDYSPALRAAGARGLRWTVSDIDGLIADPPSFLPGTEMTFEGLESPAERADIIAFLTRSAGRP